MTSGFVGLCLVKAHAMHFTGKLDSRLFSFVEMKMSCCLDGWSNDVYAIPPPDHTV